MSHDSIQHARKIYRNNQYCKYKICGHCHGFVRLQTQFSPRHSKFTGKITIWGSFTKGLYFFVSKRCLPKPAWIFFMHSWILSVSGDRSFFLLNLLSPIFLEHLCWFPIFFRRSFSEAFRFFFFKFLRGTDIFGWFIDHLSFLSVRHVHCVKHHFSHCGRTLISGSRDLTRLYCFLCLWPK